MNTTKKFARIKNQSQYFLVLVPHRDTRSKLQKHSLSFYENGLSNVFPFPHASPLALLSKPLKDDELKNCAKVLRESIGKEKLYCDDISSINLHINNIDKKLFGYKINIDTNCILKTEIKKISSIFSPVVIGAFLTNDDQLMRSNSSVRGLLKRPEENRQKNSIYSFRAAAIANMYWKPVKIDNKICYKWKIGKLFWLPCPKKLFNKTGKPC